MSDSTNKVSISVSLDEELIDRIDEYPGAKRSTMINEVMWEWVADE